MWPAALQPSIGNAADVQQRQEGTRAGGHEFVVLKGSRSQEIYTLPGRLRSGPTPASCAFPAL